MAVELWLLAIGTPVLASEEAGDQAFDILLATCLRKDFTAERVLNLADAQGWKYISPKQYSSDDDLYGDPRTRLFHGSFGDNLTLGFLLALRSTELTETCRFATGDVDGLLLLSRLQSDLGIQIVGAEQSGGSRIQYNLKRPFNDQRSIEFTLPLISTQRQNPEVTVKRTK